MANEQTFHFHIQIEAQDLWKFSMYHANRGYLGIFNGLFTLAAFYLLATQWGNTGTGSRLLLILSALLFTVWQPGILFLKAMRQAKQERLKAPMDMTFTKEGFCVAQGEQSLDVGWDEIGRVVGIRGEYILYMGQLRAYLIPDRVMGEEKEKFAGFLREILPGERLKKV